MTEQQWRSLRNKHGNLVRDKTCWESRQWGGFQSQKWPMHVRSQTPKKNNRTHMGHFQFCFNWSDNDTDNSNNTTMIQSKYDHNTSTGQS